MKIILKLLFLIHTLLPSTSTNDNSLIHIIKKNKTMTAGIVLAATGSILTSSQRIINFLSNVINTDNENTIIQSGLFCILGATSIGLESLILYNSENKDKKIKYFMMPILYVVGTIGILKIIPHLRVLDDSDSISIEIIRSTPLVASLFINYHLTKNQTPHKEIPKIRQEINDPKHKNVPVELNFNDLANDLAKKLLQNINDYIKSFMEDFKIEGIDIKYSDDHDSLKCDKDYNNEFERYENKIAIYRKENFPSYMDDKINGIIKAKIDEKKNNECQVENSTNNSLQDNLKKYLQLLEPNEDINEHEKIINQEIINMIKKERQKVEETRENHKKEIDSIRKEILIKKEQMYAPILTALKKEENDEHRKKIITNINNKYDLEISTNIDKYCTCENHDNVDLNQQHCNGCRLKKFSTIFKDKDYSDEEVKNILKEIKKLKKFLLIDHRFKEIKANPPVENIEEIFKEKIKEYTDYDWKGCNVDFSKSDKYNKLKQYPGNLPRALQKDYTNKIKAFELIIRDKEGNIDIDKTITKLLKIYIDDKVDDDGIQSINYYKNEFEKKNTSYINQCECLDLLIDIEIILSLLNNFDNTININNILSKITENINQKLEAIKDNLLTIKKTYERYPKVLLEEIHWREKAKLKNTQAIIKNEQYCPCTELYDTVGMHIFTDQTTTCRICNKELLSSIMNNRNIEKSNPNVENIVENEAKEEPKKEESLEQKQIDNINTIFQQTGLPDKDYETSIPYNIHQKAFLIIAQNAELDTQTGIGGSLIAELNTNLLQDIRDLTSLFTTLNAFFYERENAPVIKDITTLMNAIKMPTE